MRNTIVILVVLCLMATVVAAQQNAGLTDRGVRLAKQPGNVRYDIELTRGTQRAIVQPNFQFQTGDRFTLRVRVSTDSYVYVLNRTFVGSPDELRSSRQIRLVPNPDVETALPTAQSPDADRPAPSYSLVYPPSGNRILKAGVVNLIPGSQLALEMDENPGVEHMVVIVSPKPLDIGTMFNSTTGELKTSPTGTAAQRDNSSGVYDKLRQELTTMARNTQFEEYNAPTRSITFEPIPVKEPVRPAPVRDNPQLPVNTPDNVAKKGGGQDPKTAAAGPHCVAAPMAPKQPYLVEIILAHYAS